MDFFGALNLRMVLKRAHKKYDAKYPSGKAATNGIYEESALAVRLFDTFLLQASLKRSVTSLAFTLRIFT
jgi:hypothetical protein